jgi:nucleotide-binding universal stress UspA family protein
MLSNLNPLGIVLGIVYLGLVIGIVWWMLVVRPARQELNIKLWPKKNCIIVPLTGSKDCWQALDVACQVACERHAQLIFAHVIEIPMTLGLDVPLEAAEEHGRLILQDGQKVARKFHLPFESRLLRHRSTVLAICELAQEVGAETIVLEPGKRAWWSLARVERNIELLRRAPCEVLIAKAAAAA